jgi:hypothetical protein
MARLSRPVLLAVLATFVVMLVPTAGAARVTHKPPKDGCDLVDQKKLDALLGVSTGTPVPEPLTGGVACNVPIPYDAATCTAQPEPAVLVGARKEKTNLPDQAEQVTDAGYEVQPLKGKAYGKKGAFLAAFNGWTFFGAKGDYAVQVQAFDPCGSVSDEQLARVTQALAKSVVKQV